MTRYIGEPDYQHGEMDSIGVLMVNLGTPDAPTPRALRRYLKEFLWDPRVVEVPRPIWWLALNGIILNTRPKRSAHAYQSVWTDEGSPLLSISKRQAAALEKSLQAKLPGPVKLALGMRYGQPSVAAGLDELRRQAARRIVVLPLYPQYSATTTGSVFDAVADVLKGWRWVPELRFINQYYDRPDYIQALADSIRQAWMERERGERLVFSFHGIPRRYLLNGDPYYCHVQKTARLVAENLRLNEGEWQVSFQSRVGREEWLRPYTDELLKSLPKEGVKRLDIVCPGFSADCLETLEEIAVENRDYFMGAGGEAYHYIPALNDAPAHIDALANVVLQHVQGWPQALPEYDREQIAQAGSASLERAKVLGAKQ